VYRPNEMRIRKQALALCRAAKPVLYLTPRDVRMGEDTKAAALLRPLAGKDCKFRHKKGRLAASRTGLDIQGL
jgi:hypothetical protein